jgi:hypothetical protein
VGKEQQHLRLTLRHGKAIMRAIGFDMGKQLAQAKSSRLDVVFTPQRHEWNDRVERQLVLKDFKPHPG